MPRQFIQEPSMKCTTWRRTIALAAVSLATVGTLAACGSSEEAVPSTPMPMMSSVAPSPSVDTQALDIMFAQMMIPHHQQAVLISTWALKQGNNPAVKKLAARIISSNRDGHAIAEI